MILLEAHSIHKWDEFTIKNEPISSIDLMERASNCFIKWFLTQNGFLNKQIIIFCGTGNNGGDGLAIARMLRDHSYDVFVIVRNLSKSESINFSINKERLLKYGDVGVIDYEDFSIGNYKDFIIIDALLGIGTNRPVDGPLKNCIELINDLPAFKTISIDMPSGLPSEGICTEIAVKSDIVFTFQVPKLSFFLKENQKFIGQWIVGDIGLNKAFLDTFEITSELIDKNLVASFFKPRTKFQHKGDFGHVAMFAGQKGMIGAAVLSTKAALKTGVGLVTAFVPSIASNVIHNSIPEVMVKESGLNYLEDLDNSILDSCTIGIGPGIGTHESTKQLLENILRNYKRQMVIDADALNMVAKDKSLLKLVPKNSIFTPHPKEFERLFGSFKNSVDMFQLQKQASEKYQIYIVLKGAHTRISTPSGNVYINNTGNPGMATAGSGDVLTGIITSLLAQKYCSNEAVVIGVYLHGLAGDFALESESYQSMAASDIITHIGKAYKSLNI